MLQRIQNQIVKGQHQRDFLVDFVYDDSATHQPIVIFAHGFKGFKDWGPYNLVADYFAQRGFFFCKFNFSHNGTTVEQPTDFADLEAFGNNNFTIELDDLGVVIDEVVKQNAFVDASKIYMIGHSRGGGIVMLKATEDKRVQKIATWASVNEFGKFWPEEAMKALKEKGVIFVPNARTNQQMPIYWQMYENYNANQARLHIPSNFKSLTIPALIVHGTKDETVPFKAAEELVSWNINATLFAIENANHNFGGKHPWDSDALPEDLKMVIDETIRFFNA
jgi:dipeptidyl aminopeptidase/acylaminoacyl peptidase